MIKEVTSVELPVDEVLRIKKRRILLLLIPWVLILLQEEFQLLT